MQPDAEARGATLDRYRGAMLGLAVGDALGTTLEFRAPGTFERIDDLVGGGPFQLHPGQWTDDTSMALCLAQSLIDRRGFDALDQMNRYLRWRDEGYFSSIGHCFDIGSTVAAALRRYESTGNPLAGSTDPNSAGNGSLMRLAPIPMAYAHAPNEAIAQAGHMSRTTHATREAVDACRYFAGLLVGALAGVPRDILLRPRYHPAMGQWPAGALAPAVERVAQGSFLARRPPDIRGSGYVVESLEAALWAFATTDDFRRGALAAVNLGDDADTTGAIYGQLAGACHGEVGIHADWLVVIHRADDIRRMAESLHQLARESTPVPANGEGRNESKDQ